MKAVYKRILFVSPVIVGWTTGIILALTNTLSYMSDITNTILAFVLIILPVVTSNVVLQIATTRKYGRYCAFDYEDGGGCAPTDEHLSVLHEDD
jgi:hypothetical protein